MLILALALLYSATAQAPRFPNTQVQCASSVTPQNVPLGAGVAELFGTWYTIAIPVNATEPGNGYVDNVCTQVIIQPDNPSKPTEKANYIGSYNELQPRGRPKEAVGELLPLDLDGGVDPALYNLQLSANGFVFSDGLFWVAAAAGDGTTTSAMVTYTCPKEGAAIMDNAQIFFLSRQPYLVPPVTYDSLANLARRALGAESFDAFGELLMVPQQQGWCDYRYTDTFTPTTVVKAETSFISLTGETTGIILCLLVSLVTLIWLCLRARKQPNPLGYAQMNA